MLYEEIGHSCFCTNGTWLILTYVHSYHFCCLEDRYNFITEQSISIGYSCLYIRGLLCNFDANIQSFVSILMLAPSLDHESN